MTLRDNIVIHRPLADVWPWIVNPERFQQWNEKIDSMEARDRFVFGQAFTTHYHWNNKPLQCRTTVAAFEEGRLLELKHDRCLGPGIRRDMEVVERVVLKDGGDRVTVTKTLTIRNHGITWIALPLIWLIGRLGKPTQPSRLKALCEGVETPASPDHAPAGKPSPRTGKAPGQQEEINRLIKTPLSPWSLLIAIAVIGSFVWLLVNSIVPVSSAIVFFHADGYRPATFTIEKIHYVESKRSGLTWGFLGSIGDQKERLFDQDMVEAKWLGYERLRKQFPPGTELDVWYNPDVTRTLFQGRTIRVMPYTPDLMAPHRCRFQWWVQFALLPFVIVLFVAAKLQRKL